MNIICIKTTKIIFRFESNFLSLFEYFDGGLPRWIYSAFELQNRGNFFQSQVALVGIRAYKHTRIQQQRQQQQKQCKIIS